MSFNYMMKTKKDKIKKPRNCCNVNNKKTKQCIRKSDGKIFKLPRRFTKKKCKIRN